MEDKDRTCPRRGLTSAPNRKAVGIPSTLTVVRGAVSLNTPKKERTNDYTN